MSVSICKLLTVVILGFCAIMLCTIVLTTQVQVTQLKIKIKQQSRMPAGLTKKQQKMFQKYGLHPDDMEDMDDLYFDEYYDTYDENDDEDDEDTVNDDDDDDDDDYHNQNEKNNKNGDRVYLHVQHHTNNRPSTGSSWKTSRDAYWRYALASIRDWDALINNDSNNNNKNNYNDDINYNKIITDMDDNDMDTLSIFLMTSSSYNKTAADPSYALLSAARAGHSTAQHYLATAYASGMWPIEEASHDNLPFHLHVPDDWFPSSSNPERRQVHTAYLYWHMAAMAGNVEAAMALAYRMETQAKQNTNKGNEKNSINTKHKNSKQSDNPVCQDTLPYYEAAAHGIIDQLEASIHSRAKVLPPQDRHHLAKVHMHGGTSSQLEWHNKPDESPELLQFYHLKATTATTLTTSSGGSTTSIDVNAASALAHLYHYGIRGVPQNLTLALQYYEIAADHNHAESAGNAGIFHVYGMGKVSQRNGDTKSRLRRAYDYFLKGAPYGLDGCRRKHDQAKRQQSSKDSNEHVVTCDAQSLNGLGLLHLFGVPGKIEKDAAQAERYFVLAREMGETDASYNLGMMWLGWKTHFQTFDKASSSLGADGTTPVVDPTSKTATVVNTVDSGSSDKSKAYSWHVSAATKGKMFKGPTAAELRDALKQLEVAANKKHIQATHRLGMIYSHGIALQGSALAYDTIRPDCEKAKTNFQWIVNNASTHRSKRLRQAYKDYIAGDLSKALRNYWMAAETGSEVGQVNAAFLLERGVCLSLSPADCAKASVRLWKAAAVRDNPEACLRVGDSYYFGRLRSRPEGKLPPLPPGPFGWVQYIIFPDIHLPPLWDVFSKNVVKFIAPMLSIGTDPTSTSKECPDPNDSSCEATKEENVNEDEEAERSAMQKDLATAAQYYQIAAEKHNSPRAHFNLGFMHEWGLGLKQDFPLSKRHYDLAGTGNSNEAALAVEIALITLSIHEFIVKMQVAWEDWMAGRSTLSSFYQKQPTKDSNSNSNTNDKSRQVIEPRMADGAVGQPMPSQRVERTRSDVIMSHLLSWESLAIVILTIIVIKLGQIRQTRQGQRQRQRQQQRR